MNRFLKLNPLQFFWSDEQCLKNSWGLGIAVVQISSDSQEHQTTQAMNALAEIIRLLVKEYPLVFVGESGTLKIAPSNQFFPYEVSLTIKKRIPRRKSSKDGKQKTWSGSFKARSTLQQKKIIGNWLQKEAPTTSSSFECVIFFVFMRELVGVPWSSSVLGCILFWGNLRNLWSCFSGMAWCRFGPFLSLPLTCIVYCVLICKDA